MNASRLLFPLTLLTLSHPAFASEPLNLSAEEAITAVATFFGLKEGEEAKFQAHGSQDTSKLWINYPHHERYLIISTRQGGPERVGGPLAGSEHSAFLAILAGEPSRFSLVYLDESGAPTQEPLAAGFALTKLDVRDEFERSPYQNGIGQAFSLIRNGTEYQAALIGTTSAYGGIHSSYVAFEAIDLRKDATHTGTGTNTALKACRTFLGRAK